MTPQKLGALLHAVKRSHWDPVVGMRMFRKHHPEVEVTPADYGYAVGVGRTVFPSIKGLPEGPFPVYPSRPFWDERLWNTDEQREWESECRAL